MRFQRFCLLLSLAVSLAQSRGQEWTRFRGPNGAGLSAAKTIPTRWAPEDFNWKLTLPGPGHSSPVLWGDKLFVLSGDDTTNRVWLMCVDVAQGRALWQKGFPITTYRKNASNSTASSTPAVDAQRVYVLWSLPERLMLAAFDHQGQVVWERNLGPYRNQHGGGVSPIIHGDKVILSNEQDGESFLIALDSATGETRWKTPRTTKETAYSTPCLYEPEQGKPVLVFTSHAHGVYGVEPEGGQVAWELAGAFDKRVVSSPLLAGGLIIGSCGSGGGGNYVVAVRPGESATGKKPELAYTFRRSAPYVPTSVCVGPLLFLWGDDGAVSCVQAATGELKWQQRLGKHFFSSPVCVDGRLFCVSTTGDVLVVRAGGEFELLATNSLGETTHSTPAVAGGRMYIHTLKHLVSVGGAKP